MNAPSWVPACWPAPARIHAGSTTRCHGFSVPPYASFNLALHVGDSNSSVLRNRQRLSELLGLTTEPYWLEQIHGNRVIDLNAKREDFRADGARTDHADRVCAILTADCLPILLCNSKGTEVAAIHAGWRGLTHGIIAAGLARLRSPAHELLAWLGPAIGPLHYEIDEPVRRAMAPLLTDPERVFQSSRPGHWRLDLCMAARQILQAAGVHSIYGGDHCTYREAEHYYSYRRDGQTGRMASLIWIAGQKSLL